MENKLFTKDELHDKVYSLKGGEKPFADCTQTYVDELLDEMFPQHKSIQVGVDKVNALDYISGRTEYFVLEEIEI